MQASITIAHSYRHVEQESVPPQVTAMVVGVLECGDEELLRHLLQEARLAEWLAGAAVEVGPTGGPTRAAPPRSATRRPLRAGAKPPSPPPLAQPVDTHHLHKGRALYRVLRSVYACFQHAIVHWRSQVQAQPQNIVHCGLLSEYWHLVYNVLAPRSALREPFEGGRNE